MTDSRRPVERIILMSIDNLRGDCIAGAEAPPTRPGAWQRPLRTDHLAAFAAQGTWLRNCFTGAPYTTASHASMLTGMFPPKHGVREYFRTAIAASVPTLLQRFRRAGWRTVFATDFPHLLGPLLGFTRDVDCRIEEDDEATLDALASDGAPVFCFWHFGTVHNPFGLTSIEFDGDAFRRETERVAAMAGIPEPCDVSDEDWMERDRSHDERRLRQWYFRATDAMYRAGRFDELMALYVAGVEAFDGNRFRRIVEALEARGLDENTLIVITADHGEEYSPEVFAHFNSVRDSVVRVPLILRGPGVPSGVVNDMVVRSVDIAPTILDLAGLDSAPPAFDGESLVGSLRPTGRDSRVAFGECLFGMTDQIREYLRASSKTGRMDPVTPMYDTWLAYVRDARWKLVLAREIASDRTRTSLFDMTSPVGELRDVAVDNPEVCARLDMILRARLAEGEEAQALDESDLSQLAEELASLGYSTR